MRRDAALEALVRSAGDGPAREVLRLLRARKLNVQAVTVCHEAGPPWDALLAARRWPTLREAVDDYLAWLAVHPDRAAGTHLIARAARVGGRGVRRRGTGQRDHRRAGGHVSPRAGGGRARAGNRRAVPRPPRDALRLARVVRGAPRPGGEAAGAGAPHARRPRPCPHGARPPRAVPVAGRGAAARGRRAGAPPGVRARRAARGPAHRRGAAPPARRRRPRARAPVRTARARAVAPARSVEVEDAGQHARGRARAPARRRARRPPGHHRGRGVVLPGRRPGGPAAVAHGAHGRHRAHRRRRGARAHRRRACGRPRAGHLPHPPPHVRELARDAGRGPLHRRQAPRARVRGRGAGDVRPSLARAPRAGGGAARPPLDAHRGGLACGPGPRSGLDRASDPSDHSAGAAPSQPETQDSANAS